MLINCIKNTTIDVYSNSFINDVMKFYFLLTINPIVKKTVDNARLFIINKNDIIYFNIKIDLINLTFKSTRHILNNNECISSNLSQESFSSKNNTIDNCIKYWFDNFINKGVDFKNRFTRLDFSNESYNLKTPYLYDEYYEFEFLGGNKNIQT